jgi:hypothetical protein
MRESGRSADFPSDGDLTGRRSPARDGDLAGRLADLPAGHPSGYAADEVTDPDEADPDGDDLEPDPQDPDALDDPADEEAEPGATRARRSARAPGHDGGWSLAPRREPYRPWFTGEAAADPWFADGQGN